MKRMRTLVEAQYLSKRNEVIEQVFILNALFILKVF